MVRLKCFVAVLCISLAQSAYCVSIIFDPGSQDVTLGDQASVDVVLSQPGGVFVGAFDVSFDYDPSVLSLAGLNFGSSLGDGLDSFQDSIASVGNVAVAETSFLFDLSGVQSGVENFVLFSLVFDALSVGSSGLAFSNVLVGDDFGAPIDVQTLGGAITVLDSSGPNPGPNPVPEPGSMILLLAGCAALLRRNSRFLPNAQTFSTSHLVKGLAR